jgi:hypothetical protein
MRMLVNYNEEEEREDKGSNPQRNRCFPEEMLIMWKWESRTPNIARGQQLIPVILATQKAEIRKRAVRSQSAPGK